MTKNQIIEITKQHLQEMFSNDASGHDWFHIERVWKLAKTIAESEKNVDMFVVEMGALLHDIADHKFHGGDDTIGPKQATEFLSQFSLEPGQVNKIVDMVFDISYKGAGVSTMPRSKEGEIVQDADRLDAIGAIGIARAFSFGGSKNRLMYHPQIKPVCHTSFEAYKKSTAPTINHFYEKLLLIKDRLNTDAAKQIAKSRHAFMEDFLREFYANWDGKS